MALQTRQNPETGILEVLIDDRWIKFEDYRKLQIEDAYQSSIKFLRERLGEDAAKQLASRVSDDAND